MKTLAVKTFPSGREVCQETAAGKRDYGTRLQAMRARQNNRCAMCGHWLAGVYVPVVPPKEAA